jgi:integrase
MYAGASVFNVFSYPSCVPFLCSLLVQVQETKKAISAPLPQYTVRILLSLASWFGLFDHSKCSSLLAKQITVSPHVLRHTFLRKLAEEKGVQYAKEASGHKSDRYIWRYVKPNQESLVEAIDELDV